MFLPQAPSARATPSPGRPAILHCAKDRSIPWHTIRIIGCGVVPSCMYIHIPCKVTPVCASVARLVSGVVWYSTAPKPSTRHSNRPVPCTVYAFVVVRCVWSSVQVHIGGSPGVREIFDSFMGDWVSTEHSGRVRRFARYSRPRTEIRSDLRVPGETGSAGRFTCSDAQA